MFPPCSLSASPWLCSELCSSHTLHIVLPQQSSTLGEDSDLGHSAQATENEGDKLSPVTVLTGVPG